MKHRYGHFLFSASCSGACKFRHNLSLPQGPGGAYCAWVRPVTGQFYVSAIDANTITVTVTNLGPGSAWIGEFAPTENIGDYNA